MSRYTDLLRLDAGKVASLSTAQHHYAIYLRNQSSGDMQGDRQKDQLKFAASYYLSAALYKSLLEPAQGVKLFTKAKDCYQEIGHPFYRICEILGKSNDLGMSDETEFFSTKPDEVFYKVIETFEFGNPSPYKFIIPGRYYYEVLDIEAMPPIGRLQTKHGGISYQLAIGALVEVFQMKMFRSKDFHYLKAMLNDINHLFDVRRKNESWKKLRPGILPYDPVSLAVIVAVLRYFKDYDEVIGIFKSFGEEGIGLFFVDMAWDIKKAKGDVSYGN